MEDKGKITSKPEEVEEGSVQENLESQPIELGDYQLTRDGTWREIREPIKYGDYFSLAVLS